MELESKLNQLEFVQKPAVGHNLNQQIIEVHTIRFLEAHTQQLQAQIQEKNKEITSLKDQVSFLSNQIEATNSSQPELVALSQAYNQLEEAHIHETAALNQQISVLKLQLVG